MLVTTALEYLLRAGPLFEPFLTCFLRVVLLSAECSRLTFHVYPLSSFEFFLVLHYPVSPTGFYNVPAIQRAVVARIR